MSWYSDEPDTDAADESGEGCTSRPVVTDQHDARDELSRDITVESDADDTDGRYSRDAAISFRESREKAQRSREARESRGETVDDSPLPSLEDGEESALGVSDSAHGSASVTGDDDTDDELGDKLRAHLREDLEAHTDTLATGKTLSNRYRLVETTVESETVYAMIENTSSGVAYRQSLGTFGTSISTPAVGLNSTVLVDAIASEQKQTRRQYRYRDVDVVDELSYNQISAIQHYYREVATELMHSAVLMSGSEREEFGVSVSVIDGCVIVGGVGVTARLSDELEMSEKQLDVVLGAFSEAVSATGEMIPEAARSEVRKMETLSGRECVVAGRLFLD